MTREEREKAIDELARHKNEVQNDFGWNTTLLNSLDAAIEALKAEPCENCDKWEDDKTACQKCGADMREENDEK